jgi:chloride channel protein, CIC family
VIAIQVVAALIGFSIFYATDRGFADVLRIIEPAGYTLQLWHVVAGIALGVVGALVGIIFARLTRAMTQTSARIENVVVRTTLAGAALGLLGMALPLTLFLGTTGVVEVTNNAAAMGVGLLILLALAKMVATSGALGFGFIGGPIFPLLFVGAALGNAVHLLVPAVPSALAIGAMMASVPGGIVSIPLSVAVIAMLISSTGLTNAVPVLTAAVTSFIVVRGLLPAPQPSSSGSDGAEGSLRTDE